MAAGAAQGQSLERALGVLVRTFQRYGERRGSLSKRQLEALLEEELPSLRCLRLREATLEQLMASLDRDRDGEVSFPEFVRFLAAACTFFHDFFRDGRTALPHAVSVQDGRRAPETEEPTPPTVDDGTPDPEEETAIGPKMEELTPTEDDGPLDAEEEEEEEERGPEREGPL